VVVSMVVPAIIIMVMAVIMAMTMIRFVH